MFSRDLRYGIRTLRRSPGFTLIAAATLAIGIGASTLTFSIVNAELLRPLPFVEPNRLMQVAEKNEKLNLPVFSSSVLNYLSWREQSQSFEAMGAIGYASYALTGRGEAEQFSGNRLTPSLCPLLGIRPIIGRTFLESEDKPGSPPVAMLAEAAWRKKFGGDPSVIGQHIVINGIDTEVVGVIPATAAVLLNGEILTPLTIEPGREFRLQHEITTVGRVKPGVTLTQAQAEMDTVFARLAAEHQEIKDWGIRLVPFSKWFVDDSVRRALVIVMGLVMFVLLIACANVANLLLSRGAGRQNEFAIRSALGASRGMVVRQLLVESLLLSLLGGGVGVLCAAAGLRALNQWLPPNFLPVPDVAPDSTVLFFAIVATFATGVLFGIAPALLAAKRDLASQMKQGGRVSTGGVPLLRNGLVAAELALATCLVICSGLLLASLLRLESVPLGFPTEKLLTFQLAPPKTRYPDNLRNWNFYQQVLAGIAAVPGVSSAAISSGLPFGSGNYSTTPMTSPGESELAVGQATPVDWRSVSPGYFKTMAVPFLSGRDFTLQDGPQSLPTAIVSRETARKLWGTRDALGRIVRVVGSGKEFTVIGVVGDVRNTALNQPPASAIYFPAAARIWPVMDVAVRTAVPPESITRQIADVVRGLDPELPVNNVQSMEQLVLSNAAQPRLNASMVAAFAAISLLLAAIGVYGVLSYTVNQRTREIGVRMALGAHRPDVIWLILRQGMTVALIGIGAGLVGAIAFGKVLESLMFETQVWDPVPYVAAGGLLTIAAAIACYVPARRASLVDPIVALRGDS